MKTKKMNQTLQIITRAAARDRAYDFVCSTSAKDSYGEIIEQDWDLDRYKGNPVVLFEHERGAKFLGADPALPIGYAENVRVENGELRARIVFVSEDANPLAERVRKLVEEGAISCVSVGFRPGDVRTEKRDGHDVVVLSNNELFEISVVSIPANPEATVLRRKSAFMAEARELAGVTTADPNLEAKAYATQVRAAAHAALPPHVFAAQAAPPVSEVRARAAAPAVDPVLAASIHAARLREEERAAAAAAPAPVVRAPTPSPPRESHDEIARRLMREAREIGKEMTYAQALLEVMKQPQRRAEERSAAAREEWSRKAAEKAHAERVATKAATDAYMERKIAEKIAAAKAKGMTITRGQAIALIGMGRSV